jgi:hypothetical protein
VEITIDKCKFFDLDQSQAYDNEIFGVLANFLWMKRKRVGLHSHLQLKNNTLKDHSH